MCAPLRNAALAMGITFALVPSVFAQERAGAVERRWAFSATIGWGPAEHTSAVLEESLVEAGFDDVSPSYCIPIGALCAPSQPHPRTIGDRRPVWTFTVSYAARPWLHLRGIYAPGGEMKETVGFREGGTVGNFIDLLPSVRTVALVPVLTLDGVMRAGVGPSLNMIELSSGDGGDVHRATRIGVVFDAGLTLPPGSRFFLEITGQYRYAAPTVLGPFEVPAILFLGDGAVLPGARVELGYGVLSVGGGVRF